MSTFKKKEHLKKVTEKDSTSKPEKLSEVYIRTQIGVPNFVESWDQKDKSITTKDSSFTSKKGTYSKK